MLPIAAHLVRTASQERARSALPGAPTRRPGERTDHPTPAPVRVRHRMATGLRRVADQLEPVAH